MIKKRQVRAETPERLLRLAQEVFLAYGSGAALCLHRSASCRKEGHHLMGVAPIAFFPLRRSVDICLYDAYQITLACENHLCARSDRWERTPQ